MEDYEELKKAVITEFKHALIENNVPVLRRLTLPVVHALCGDPKSGLGDLLYMYRVRYHTSMGAEDEYYETYSPQMCTFLGLTRTKYNALTREEQKEAFDAKVRERLSATMSE